MMVNLVVTAAPIFLLLCLTSANRQSEIKLRKDVCTQNNAYGSCNQMEVKWYYDFVSDECKQFHYSSCGGNQNRFNKRKDCENFCMDPELRYNLQDFEIDYFQ